MVNVEQLVPEKHTYRKLKKLLDFTRIAKSVKENVAGKWFCGFSLLEKTPDYITNSPAVKCQELEG